MPVAEYMYTITSLFLRSALSFAPPLLVFLLLPPPDSPWPAWAVAGFVLLFSRFAAGGRAKAGAMDELLAALPFLALALAAIARFSLLEGLSLFSLGFECGSGLLLVALVSREALRTGPSFLRPFHGLIGTLLLFFLVWLWSFEKDLLVAALEGLGAILVAVRQTGGKR